MRDEQSVDPLLLKEPHYRLDVLLIPHHAIRQHALQIHVMDFPLVEFRTNQSFQPHRIFMGEDEFPDRAEADQGFPVRIHSLEPYELIVPQPELQRGPYHGLQYTKPRVDRTYAIPQITCGIVRHGHLGNRSWNPRQTPRATHILRVLRAIIGRTDRRCVEKVLPHADLERDDLCAQPLPHKNDRTMLDKDRTDNDRSGEDRAERRTGSMRGQINDAARESIEGSESSGSRPCAHRLGR